MVMAHQIADSTDGIYRIADLVKHLFCNCRSFLLLKLTAAASIFFFCDTDSNIVYQRRCPQDLHLLFGEFFRLSDHICKCIYLHKMLDTRRTAVFVGDHALF